MVPRLRVDAIFLRDREDAETALLLGPFLGGRMAPDGADAGDRRYAVAAGVVALVVRWLDSDFTGDDAPDRMASRLLDAMLGLAGVAD